MCPGCSPTTRAIARSGGNGPRVSGEPAQSSERVSLRRACAADIAPVTAIYAHHVRNGLASFEVDPPDKEEMARRYASVSALGFPYLVAEFDGLVAGYAYAAPYRTRPAYRYTVEDSVYIHHAYAGRGIHASIRLHEKFGFVRAGLLAAAGWKFERWVDSVLMQRALGAGDAAPPADPVDTRR